MRSTWMALAVSFAAFQPSASAARPADTLPDLSRTLALCSRIQAPPPEWLGAEITVRFSLRRDGHLIGQPRITYSKLPAISAEQKPFMAAALAALATCFPVEVTPGLGSAIAGRMLTVRIGTRSGSVHAPLSLPSRLPDQLRL